MRALCTRLPRRVAKCKREALRLKYQLAHDLAAAGVTAATIAAEAKIPLYASQVLLTYRREGGVR